MKKLLIAPGLIVMLDAAFVQTICLQRMPSADTSGLLGITWFYNAQFGPLDDFNNDGLRSFPIMPNIQACPVPVLAISR
jgi:hypothetical protein